MERPLFKFQVYFIRLNLSIIILLAFNLVSRAQDSKITEKNISFISYPDFPEGHSTWDDIGYNSKFDKVFIGVTNHKDKIAYFDYDCASKVMKYRGLISDLAHLRKFQWQGKIHTKIIEGPDGNMYFATDGGESIQEYLMDHPEGYAGGFFMKWNPVENKLTNLGMGLQYESIKDVDVDVKTGKIYAVSYPQVHFLIYDPVNNYLRDLGRLGSTHVPRVIFTDDWGNCYYVDWRQRIVKYEKDLDKLLFARESLPSFPGTPGSKIVTGITAYAKDTKNGVIYFITYGAKIIAFHPQKNGIGKIEDLGSVADLDKEDLWRPYVPNLNLGENGKLYYIVGGHGNYVKENKTVLIEFNPKTREKKVVFDFPLDEMSEATGSDTKDKEGNLYFLGRKNKKVEDSDDGKKGSTAFLIKFNPNRNVNK